MYSPSNALFLAINASNISGLGSFGSGICELGTPCSIVEVDGGPSPPFTSARGCIRDDDGGSILADDVDGGTADALCI